VGGRVLDLLFKKSEVNGDHFWLLFLSRLFGAFSDTSARLFPLNRVAHLVEVDLGLAQLGPGHKFFAVSKFVEILESAHCHLV
jgi:hypothetical protein